MTTTPPDSPFFIVGHGRSGTTLFRVMLNEHPRLVVGPETGFVTYLRRHATDPAVFADDAKLEELLRHMFRHRWIRKSWVAERNITEDELVERALAGERSAPGVMRSLFGLWAEREGKPRWGDKVPNNYRYVPTIAEWFPDAQFIHLVRDGRDVALSCLTPPFADLYDHGNVYEVAYRWREVVRRCRQAQQELGPERFMQVRYEDLTAEPERELRRVCEFLGEDFTTKMLDYHQRADSTVPQHSQKIHPRLHKSVDRARVERWRREAPRQFVLGFEALALDELKECGYTPSDLEPTALEKMRLAYEKARPRGDPLRRYRPPLHAVRKPLKKLLSTDSKDKARDGDASRPG